MIVDFKDINITDITVYQFPFMKDKLFVEVKEFFSIVEKLIKEKENELKR